MIKMKLIKKIAPIVNLNLVGISRSGQLQLKEMFYSIDDR